MLREIVNGVKMLKEKDVNGVKMLKEKEEGKEIVMMKEEMEIERERKMWKKR